MDIHTQDESWYRAVAELRTDMSWKDTSKIVTPMPFLGNLLTCGIYVLRRQPPCIAAEGKSTIRKYRKMYRTGTCHLDTADLPAEVCDFARERLTYMNDTVLKLYTTQLCTHIYSCPYPFDTTDEVGELTPLRAPSVKRIVSFVKQRCSAVHTKKPFLIIVDEEDARWFADIIHVALQNGVNVTYTHHRK